MLRNKFSRLSGTPLLAVPLAAQLAFSQSVAAQEAVLTDQWALEEIVVTARKRAETAQDVPASISVISAEAIRRSDLTSIEKLAARTPQLMATETTSGAGAQMTLRGIGSSSTAMALEQSVAVVVDGTYYGHGRVIQEGFFDLAQVEILKGPQALFYGKNATAGVIAIKTADPGDEMEIIGRMSYEFESEQGEVEGIFSTPLTDTLGLRVAVRGTEMWGSYYDNVSRVATYDTFDVATFALTPHSANPSASGPGTEQLMGRVTLKWTPTEDITNTLKVSGSYHHVDNPNWNLVEYSCPDGGGISSSSGYACGGGFVGHSNDMPADIAATGIPYAKDGRQYATYESFAVNNDLNWQFDNISITNITNYNWNNTKFLCHCSGVIDLETHFGLPQGFYNIWTTESAPWRAFSNELRVLTSYDSSFNVLLGAYYQKTKREFGQFGSMYGAEDSSVSPDLRYQVFTKDGYSKGETLAGFGQLIWTPIPQVEGTVGVRYTRETKDSMFQMPYIAAIFLPVGIPASEPGGVLRPPEQVFTNWTPEFSLSWKPTDGIMLYGAYKTGYKAGGFSITGINSRASANPAADMAFKGEKADGFEVGVKTTLADNQLRLNLNVYTYDYEDLQLDFFDVSRSTFITITADARTRGAEFEFEYAPNTFRGLSVHGLINYNKAEYTDFLAPCWAGQTPAQGCTTAPDATSTYYRQDVDGKPLSNAPEWTASLGVSYDTSLNDRLLVGFSVDGRYNDHYLVSAFANPYTAQGSYTTLDASARIGTYDRRWEFAVIGKNLTNERRVGAGTDSVVQNPTTGTTGGIPNDQLGNGNVPRTVTAQLAYRFY